MLYFIQQEGVDFTNLLQYLWFLLGHVSQSIAYHIFNNKSVKSNRKERFGQGFNIHLTSFISSLTALIRSKIDKSVAYIANQSLAVFVRDAFSHMDRGEVFMLVNKYVSQPSLPSSGSSHSVIDAGKRESESSIQMRKRVNSVSQSSSYMALQDEDSSEVSRQSSVEMELGLE